MEWRNLYPSVVLPIRRHLQKEEYTCGPASLRIILETLNGRDYLPSEMDLEQLCLTTRKTGTDPDMMIHALKHLGIKHEVPEKGTIHAIETYIRHFYLCLVDFQAHDDGSKDGHYSVVFGFDQTHFFIADPYKKKGVREENYGFRRIHKDLFEKRWHARHTDGVRAIHWMVAIPLVS